MSDASSSSGSGSSARDNVITRMRKQIGDADSGVKSSSVGVKGTTIGSTPLPLVVIYHLDTNMGDATIIVGPEKTAFVDCCFGHVPDRMIALAKKLCNQGPELIAISHFDRDHFYGISTVWPEYKGNNPTIFTPASPTELKWAAHTSGCTKIRDERDANWSQPDSDMIARMQAMFSINNGIGRSCASGNCTATYSGSRVPNFQNQNSTPIQFGLSVTFKAIEPKTSPLALSTLRNNNDSSLAWGLSAGDINYYTAGDLEVPESSLKLGKMHIVKCGHHGSDHATSSAFLKRAKPVAAIIQGASYSYNHPTVGVLQRLNRGGVKVFATDIHVDYEEIADLGKPIVAGNKSTYAGDVAIVIWSDQTFSVSCMQQSSSSSSIDHNIYAFAADGAARTLSEVQEKALKKFLDLPTLTSFKQDMNSGLLKTKRELPNPMPKFSEYSETTAKPAAEHFCNTCGKSGNVCRSCYAIICDEHVAADGASCERCYAGDPSGEKNAEPVLAKTTGKDRAARMKARAEKSPLKAGIDGEKAREDRKKKSEKTRKQAKQETFKKNRGIVGSGASSLSSSSSEGGETEIDVEGSDEEDMNLEKR